VPQLRQSRSGGKFPKLGALLSHDDEGLPHGEFRILLGTLGGSEQQLPV